MDVQTLIAAVALTSAGVFAGYTWALSDAAVPAVLLAPEAIQAGQWRLQYLKGFYISRPLCFINATTFGYLAYIAPSESLSRTLLVVAAVTTASGVPYALTFLRCTNGALSVRSDRLFGPGNGAIALTYAFDDRRSRKREKEWTTEAMIRRWQWHNAIRTIILVLGTAIGGAGVAMSKS